MTIDRHVRVTMSDGVELALTLFLPDHPDGGPFPAVLESVPTRKDDRTLISDHETFTYLASRGIAGARLDVRGTGASDGVALGEYVVREQTDNVEILAWLAEQPWCSGHLGMWGLSWGGLSAFQAAALGPPGLEAICAIHPTHDRFVTDVHYIGGALHGIEQVDRPVAMLALNGLPPDPKIVGERWLDMWIARLDSTPQWLPEWLAHQHRDEFWRHGSPSENYEKIGTPALVIGGWLDPYVDGVTELLANLPGPTRGVIGPWGHQLPANGEPGPALDHHALLHRWFAHWLLGEDTGVMEQPAVVVFARDSPPYDRSTEPVPGRWQGYESWPPPTHQVRMHLSGSSLAWEPGGADPITWRGPWTSGTGTPRWSGGGDDPVPVAGDGRPDINDECLVWTSEPLHEPIEVLGVAMLEACIQVSEPGGRVVGHLYDVDPEGNASFVTRGVSNLSHRNDPGAPSVEPIGEPIDLVLRFRATSATFAAGHRLRLTIAGSDFPVVWPPPRPVELTVIPARSVFVLPSVDTRHSNTTDLTIDLNATSSGESIGEVISEDSGQTIHRRDGKVRVERWNKRKELVPERDDLTYGWSQVVWMTGADDSPTAAVAGSVVEAELGRPGWSTKVVVSAGLAADEAAFHLDIALNALSNGVEIWARRWVESVPREWT